MSAFLPSFLTVASLHFLAVASPGPDFVMVTRNALSYGRKTGLLTGVGVTLGIVVHVSYCLLGLAVILVHSVPLFMMIKILGGLYLIYVGIRACLTPINHVDYVGVDASAVYLSDRQALKQGFLCNLLNPKATLFLLGLFTLVIDPTTPWWERGFYGAWMIMVTFVWFATMSLLITQPQLRARIWRVQPLLTKIMGMLLIGFGTELLFFV